MAGSLTVEVHNTLNPLALADWRMLFPRLPDPDDLVEELKSCHGAALRFHSVLVRDGQVPLLLIPLYEPAPDCENVVFRLALSAFEKVGKVVSDCLGLGALSCTWEGQRAHLFGFNPEAPAYDVRAARELAGAVCDYLAGTMNVSPFSAYAADEAQTMPVENLAVS